MGNTQATGHTTPTSRPSPILHQQEDHQWSNQGFPRVINTTGVPYQHKLIVPDRNAHQRLRPTGNGEILHAGGTISGRGHQWQQQSINRSTSISAVRHQNNQSQSNSQPHSQQGYRNQQKSRIPNRHNQPRVLTPSYRKDQIKRFGSEPDLRSPSSQSSQEYQGYKGRKKYKAPPPPVTSLSSLERHDYDECGIEAGSPIRRARLFKTRAETKKKPTSPVNNRRSLISNSNPLEYPLEKQKYKSTDALFESNRSHNSGSTNTSSRNSNPHRPIISRPPQMPPMQRTRSSPEFQAELKQVTRRLVNLRRDQQPDVIKNDNKLKTLDHNILTRKDVIRQKLRDFEEKPSSKTKDMMILEERTPASGKESTPELSPPKVKTFYFGMDEAQAKIPNSIGSDVSSESEPETTNDISLQLRPILPKKQLEIPRFSPAAAWKLLSVDTNIVESTIASEEGSVYLEENRIEKATARIMHPMPYRPIGQRSIGHDKSGDSGISGDETPEAVLPSPKQRGVSWTPQQDLGDDSSLEDGSNLDISNVVKFPSRPHVFSLSLPRDNHLATYLNDKNFLQPYSSLQKLKRSMSGVLATLNNKSEDLNPDLDNSDNWFLSRSAPNSLNNGFNSLETRRNKYFKEEFDVPKQTKRIMYLPQSNLENVIKKKQLSKSYENISTKEMDSKVLKPQNLQDPPKEETPRWAAKKPKKFTFQSTVRQIERKRLADKLSKEAERKEQQRLRELEAMRRVEEEFQKKRAREKASIRQQLRLYSMDETAWSSLPPNLDINNEIRAEPDGAVSSSTPSPTFKKNSDKEPIFIRSGINDREPNFLRSSDKENKATSTQILSEFRQSHREYKEFLGGSRYVDQHHQHQTTVHPRVTCNMPKATDDAYKQWRP